MKKQINFERTRVLILLATLILSLSLITAAGVARPYWDDNPLRLAPGESKIVQLTLQNTDPEDMTFKATITSDIATLDDRSDEYFVPSGEIDKPVNIKVEIPEDAETGTIYKIISSFKQISSGEGGMIRMAGAFTIDFPVEVVGEEESEIYGEPQGIPMNTIFIIAFVIIIIAIIIYVIKKKDKERIIE